jgi:hypothetical protein
MTGITPMTPQLWKRVAIAAWALLLAAVCIKPLFSPFSGTVYITYLRAGEDFANGSRLYDVIRPYTDNFRYPPIIAAAFVPFTYLPPGTGSVLWRLIGVAAFLTGLAAWARRLQPEVPLPLLFLFAIPLSIGSLSNAQANTHVIGVMLWGSVLASGGRWLPAALLVAAATLLKGYPIALGGLLALLAPFRFGLPFVLAVTAGFVLPYAFQSADYVTSQYQYLLENLNQDDRSSRPLHAGYQDFHMLLRVFGFHIPHDNYYFVQAGAGLMAAGLLLRRLRQGTPRSELALGALSLGVCWMCMFGPAVEASTYILMAPLMAFEVLVRSGMRWTRAFARAGAALFFLSVVLFAFPHAIHRPVIALGILPVAASFLAIGAVGRFLTRTNAQAVTLIPAIPPPPLRKAA